MTVMLAGKPPAPLVARHELPTQSQALRDEFQTAKVKCAVVGAYTDLTPANAAEVPFLEIQIAYVESLCKIRAQLGRERGAFSLHIQPPGQNPHANWQARRRHGSRDVRRAAAHGITIAIQNHHDVGRSHDASRC